MVNEAAILTKLGKALLVHLWRVAAEGLESLHALLAQHFI
jgi:hypothetical protein